MFLQELGKNLLTFEDESSIVFEEENKIQGWCPVPTMWLLNTALKCLENDETYLEIGSFCGRSLAAALKNNNIQASVIDPLNLLTQNGTTEDLWFKTVNDYKIGERIHLYKGIVEDFHLTLPPIGVFFYDGNHDSGHTYEALCKFKPFLAKSAIIIVDDYYIYGGDQQTVFPGHELDIKNPVKTDTDRWMLENKVKLSFITNYLNGQAIIFYEA